MSNNPQAGGNPAARARIEAALAEYPNLSSERLDELVHWFHKEASALDVALVASNEAIAERYRTFRADHIDQVKGRDVLRGLIFVSFVAAVFLLIIWRAM